MIRAAAAAFCNSAHGACDAASSTRLMITLEACIVASLKLLLRPECSIARFEFSTIGMIKVGRVGGIGGCVSPNFDQRWPNFKLETRVERAC